MANLEDKIDTLTALVHGLDKKIDRMEARIDKKFNEVDTQIKHIMNDKIGTIEIEIKQFKDINSRINNNANLIHSHAVQIGVLWAAAAAFALVILTKVFG